jgi:hypothetical protein
MGAATQSGDPREHRDLESPSGARLTPFVPVLACLALLVVALAAFQLIGLHGRVYATGSRRFEVPDGKSAYVLWSHLGIRGRVLLVFDSTAHISEGDSREFLHSLDSSPEAAPIGEDEFVDAAVHAAIARQVYVVVPDSEWETVRTSMSQYPDTMVRTDTASSRLYGARVTYLRARSLPSIGERVMVYANRSLESTYPAPLMASFADPKVCDVFTVGGR